MMAVSIFFTQTKDGAKEEKRSGEKTSPVWIVSVALSVIGSGLFAVMQKLQQVKFNQSCDSEFMVITLGFSAVSLLIIGTVKNARVALTTLRRGGGYALIAGVSNGATNLLNLTVNAMLPISIAAPSRSGVVIVMSFIISLLVFRERLSARQIIGVAIGMAALIILNL
jgi:drug/metabolite transporter (DMT)-like permease